MSHSNGLAEKSHQRPWDAIPAWLRWLVSAWLLYHVLAIATAPLVVPPTTSGLLLGVFRFFRPYLQAVNLNNGFHYFAPQPADNSTLLKFTVAQADGETVTGIIPHRRIWPRQLYHRHFMLTERMAYVPEDLQAAWHESYARCIAGQHNGGQVTLTRVEHFVPTPAMVLNGVKLDQPESFVETKIGDYTRTADQSRSPGG